MSQRPPFLDNLYNSKRQRKIECFLRVCKIIFIAGATVMIVSWLIALGARDTLTRAKRKVLKEKVIKINSDKVKTVSYSIQKQK